MGGGHLFMEYYWIQPTANSCTTMSSYLQLPQLYHSIFVSMCAYFSVCVCVCAYTGMQIHLGTIICVCIVYWAFIVIYAHVREKLLIKFCGNNCAYDGQHTTPSRNFIITVIKKKKKKAYTARKQKRKTSAWLPLHFCSDYMFTHTSTHMQFLIKRVVSQKTKKEKREAWWNPQVVLEIKPIPVVIFRKSTLFSW